jgi:hypothetical protein
MTEKTSRKTSTKAEKPSVPTAMQERYQQLVALTDAFCRDHLNDDYAQLARKAIAALCRKRPSPVTGGRADIWACAVVYALGSVNFLSDKSQKPYMKQEDICRHFGVSSSTAGNKAKQIRDALKMSQFDHHWMLPDRLEDFSPIWLINVNGLMVDIRQAPRPIQEEAFRRKLIPYIPDDRKPPHPQQEERDRLFALYDGLRRINVEHQMEMAAQLFQKGTVQPIARRLRIMDATGAVLVDDESDDVFASLAPAFDLAIYSATNCRQSVIQRYRQERERLLTDKETRVLDAMNEARFSIYKILDRHDIAGLWLADTIGGAKVWLMDRGLESSGHQGMLIAVRLFKPDDFWMSTGVFVPVTGSDKDRPENLSADTKPILDRDKLAEEMYRDYYGEAA